MKYVVTFFIYFVIFFTFYKVYFHFAGKRKDRLSKMTEIIFIERIFKTNIKDVTGKELLNIITLTNTLIFTIVCTATEGLSNIIIRILVMFVLLLPLNYIAYYLVSKIIHKRGMKK